MRKLAAILLFLIPLPNIRIFKHHIDGQTIHSMSITLVWLGYQFLMTLAVGDISNFYRD